MDRKSEGNQISYRPSEDIKKIFEQFCSGKASISRGQLIEISMRFLAAQGYDRMKEIIVGMLLNEPIDKKGEGKKTA